MRKVLIVIALAALGAAGAFSAGVGRSLASGADSGTSGHYVLGPSGYSMGNDTLIVAGSQVPTLSDGDHVVICHALGEDNKDTYIQIAPSTGVVFGHAGTGHQLGQDIIPPFRYASNSGHNEDDSLQGGQNWDAAHIAIYNNGCNVPGTTTTGTTSTGTTSTGTTSTGTTSTGTTSTGTTATTTTVPGGTTTGPTTTVPGGTTTGPATTAPGPVITGPATTTPGPVVTSPTTTTPGPVITGPTTTTPGPVIHKKPVVKPAIPMHPKPAYTK